MESNGAVQAIIARCLSDSTFQQSVSEDTAKTLLPYGFGREAVSEFERVDYRRLECFGGLITQTQHNFLWESFPITRALLKHSNLEIPFFSKYRRHCQAATLGPLSRAEKIERVVKYLRESFASDPDPDLATLYVIATHEFIIWDLQRHIESDGRIDVAPPQHRGNCSAHRFDRLIPYRPVGMRLEAYRYDPMQIAAKVQSGQIVQGRLRRRSSYVGYFIDRAGSQLHIVALNRTAWRLLRECSGTRSVRSVLRRMEERDGRAQSRLELRRLLECAWESGLIGMR
jgi:hypothetical protein